MKYRLVMFGLILLLFVSLFISVDAQQNTVCCSETTGGAFCQNVPENECKTGAQKVPTSCSSTSFCREGTCFDSNEGICMDNTPQLVCNNNGGVWSEVSPPQCNLGCCMLVDQAAFVTLVRCKKLSADLGLTTNYDSSIGSELECIQAVHSQDKGACVFDFEFEKSCKFTTKADCDSVENTDNNGTILIGGTFYSGKLCSAEELGTICGPTEKTICLDGKDEVYFVDTCGNPANIYDSSRINNQEYWTNVKTKEQSCNPSSGNIENKNCGNCNYLQGSICRDEKISSVSPNYGDNLCADLNCKSTSDGNDYLHGESWCIYDDAGNTDVAQNSVGSRFFRHICINGEEVVEACEDFRNQECIESSIGDFSQAACRVNRWQDCLAQNSRINCENSDARDCVWRAGIIMANSSSDGSCFPMNPPGLKFWEGEEARNICSQGTASCIVEFEKDIFGDEECKKNCECLSDTWIKERSDVCRALGDCGPAVNWAGKSGNSKGFEIKIGDVDDE